MSVQHQGVGTGEDVLPPMQSMKLKIIYEQNTQFFSIDKGENFFKCIKCTIMNCGYSQGGGQPAFKGGGESPLLTPK